jgi:serine protease Do
MKTTVLAAVAVAAAMLAPVGVRALAQARPEAEQNAERTRNFMVLAGRGAEIGVQVSEGRESGALVEDVRPDSPAEKAGVKRADVFVTFDGERVRSVRQFTRLVQETPPGRTVKATVLRDGQQKDLQITPQEGRGMLSGGFLDNDHWRELPDVGVLRDRLPDLKAMPRVMPFSYDFDVFASGRRLGVEVDSLSDQLAQYFGAKEGVLVRSVSDGSAASRAGLKAGDVITSVDGQPVRSREDLVRAVRDAKSDELTIGIVRDRKESSLKATVETPRRATRGARPA